MRVAWVLPLTIVVAFSALLAWEMSEPFAAGRAGLLVAAIVTLLVGSWGLERSALAPRLRRLGLVRSSPRMRGVLSIMMGIVVVTGGIVVRGIGGEHPAFLIGFSGSLVMFAIVWTAYVMTNRVEPPVTS